ncbi:MAG: adenosylcobinamide-GDP ribazoletransferase [Planctomycetota bacterium]|jgi:adenosylcobinamide-GDP ribazoletransferase
MKNLYSALSLLTIIPVGKEIQLKKEDAESVVCNFTLVGAVISGLSISAVIFIRFIKSSGALIQTDLSTVESLLLVFTAAVLTGGLHIDGLADTFDAVGSRKDRESALEIMKDSNIGTFGLCAVVFSLLFKIVLLSSIPNEITLWVFAAAVIFGRWAMIISAAVGNYARREDEGIGGLFIDNSSIRAVYYGSIVVLLFSAASPWTLGLVRTLFTVSACGLGALLMSKYFSNKLGGLTGDTLGTVNEVSEVIVIFLFYCTI